MLRSAGEEFFHALVMLLGKQLGFFFGLLEQYICYFILFQDFGIYGRLFLLLSLSVSTLTALSSLLAIVSYNAMSSSGEKPDSTHRRSSLHASVRDSAPDVMDKDRFRSIHILR